MSAEKFSAGKNSIAERVLAAAGIAAAAAGAFGVAYFDPTNAGFFPVCPFHTLTGLNCPGCGLTRGFHALLNGDIVTALHFNLMLPFYFLFFSYLLISLFLILLRARGLEFRLFSPVAIYGFLVLTLIFSVVRNLPFYPFNLLAI